MISLDFETYSEAKIADVGVSRYAEDPSTEVMCVCWGDEDEVEEYGQVDLWYPGLPLPQSLMHHIHTGEMFSAFNAQFEIAIWEQICVKHMGWPSLPLDRWCDSQSDALALGLPANLDDLTVALDAPQKKDAAGHKIMLKLCKPCKPSKKHPGTRWLRTEVAQDYHHLYTYCQQDVRAEVSAVKRMPYRATALGHPERKIWKMTVETNQRGIPIDIETVDAIIGKIDEKVALINTEIQRLIPGLKTIGQKDVIKNRINEISDKKLLNMQGPTLLRFLRNKNLNKDARRIIELYAMANYTSIAKFKKMKAQICSDGTIKDNHRYHGAATGRDSGSGVQIQNLPRAQEEAVDLAIDLLQNHTLEEVEAIFGNILALASAMCRPVLCAPRGWRFFNADLGQIEARMTAWVAKEEDILDSFRSGRDIYKTAASGMYGIPYEKVSKHQRQAGKIAILACGFQGGKGALLGFAEQYGITFTDDEAQEIVNAFRLARPKLVATWKAFGEAAKLAVQNPGELFQVETNSLFGFFVKEDFLYLSMPNGRVLSFPQPRWEKWMMPWGTEAFTVTHMWCNGLKGNKWERRAMSGASFMQSVVQGLSRDVLMEGCMRLHDIGYPHIFRVHDELTSCIREDEGDLDEFATEFIRVPKWCPTLPIICDPWVDKRYHK